MSLGDQNTYGKLALFRRHVIVYLADCTYHKRPSSELISSNLLPIRQTPSNESNHGSLRRGANVSGYTLRSNFERVIRPLWNLPGIHSPQWVGI